MPDAVRAALAAETANTLGAAAPAAQNDFGLSGVAIQMALALLLLLGVIFVAYLLLKKFGPRMGLPARSESLKIVGQLAIGPKRSVVLVRFLNRVLVLGVTEHNINLLTEAKTDHDAPELDFNDLLRQTSASKDSS